MNCPRGIKDCTICPIEKPFNQWLPCNEKIVDFIRWKEVAYYVTMFTVLIVWLEWWGLLLAIVLDSLNHLEGGPVIYDDTREEYPPNTCSAGVADCTICNNPYSHEFNASYKEPTLLESLDLPFIR